MEIWCMWTRACDFCDHAVSVTFAVGRLIMAGVETEADTIRTCDTFTCESSSLREGVLCRSFTTSTL